MEEEEQEKVKYSYLLKEQPFILFLFICWGRGGGHNGAKIYWEVGNILDRSPACRKASMKKKTIIQTHIWTCAVFTI